MTIRTSSSFNTYQDTTKSQVTHEPQKKWRNRIHRTVDDLVDTTFEHVDSYGMIYGTNNSNLEEVSNSSTQLTGAFDTNWVKVSASVNPDQANGQVQVNSGTYKADVNLTFSGTVSTQFDFELYMTGTATGFTAQKTTTSTADEMNHVALTGLVDVTTTGDIDVRASGAADSQITVTDGQLVVEKLN